MKVNVWILNHFGTSMMFSKGGRHYWFAKYLKRNGYEPVIFSCNTKHGIKEKWVETNELWVEEIADEINVPFVVVNAPMYASNGKDRLVNMYFFYRNVQKAAKEYAKEHGKPDIIYASSVHPLTLVAGIKIAKHFGVKCISEIRDLWPESIFVYLNRFSRNSILGKCLYAGEKWIYKKSDALLFTMAGGKDYIIEHRWDKSNKGPIDINSVFHINNGVDLEAFDANAAKYTFTDNDLDSNHLFKVVYAGSIRKVNKIDVILDVAKIMCKDKVVFIIFGDGDDLNQLMDRAKKESIDNVIFKGKVEKKYIPSIDKKADVNIVHWESSPLLKYGDSSNKSFEYYAAGRPVLYTTSPGYSIVKKYKCGLVVENQDPESIVSAIRSIMNLTEDERKSMGNRARSAAEYYDFKNLTCELIKIIENL